MTASILAEVLIVLTNYFQLGNIGKPTSHWLSETSRAYCAFKSVGCEVQSISPKRGGASVEPGSLDLSDPVHKKYQEDAEAQKRVNSTLVSGKIQPFQHQVVYQKGPYWQMFVSTQDRSVSGQPPGASAGVATEVIALLKEGKRRSHCF